jgi:hypothetical protein
VEWVFTDPSYLKFPDKKIDQWSYNEHVTCNIAIDRSWIDVRVGGCSDLPAFVKEATHMGMTSALNLSSQKAQRKESNDNESLSIHISKLPEIRRHLHLTGADIAKSSNICAPSTTRRYFEVSNQVLEWTKGKRDKAFRKASASSGNFETVPTALNTAPIVRNMTHADRDEQVSIRHTKRSQLSQTASKLRDQSPLVDLPALQATKLGKPQRLAARLDRNGRLKDSVGVYREAPCLDYGNTPHQKVDILEDIPKSSSDFSRILSSQIPSVSFAGPHDQVIPGQDMRHKGSSKGSSFKAISRQERIELPLPGSSKQNPIEMTEDRDMLGCDQPEAAKKTWSKAR